MLGRDIFSFGAAGYEPTLESLLDMLPDPVQLKLLQIGSIAGITGALKKLDVDAAQDLTELADLLVSAAMQDREQYLEPILVEHKVPFGNKDLPSALALQLVEKVGIVAARKALVDAMKPGAIDMKGTFSDYQAEDMKLDTINVLKMSVRLEKELEAKFINQKPKRLVKVKAMWASKMNRLIVGIFFQRPAAEGRDIDAKDKRLFVRSYDRPAASTFLTLKRSHRRVVVTFRSPNSSVAQRIREGLSKAIWDKPSAVEARALDANDLSVFLDPNFDPDVPKAYDNQVSSVIVTDIQVRVSTGNRVTVHAIGRKDSALDDFQTIATGVPVLTKKAIVEKVTLKILSKDTRHRIITVAEVQKNSMMLDERYRLLVEDHLEHWGVRGDDKRP